MKSGGNSLPEMEQVSLCVAAALYQRQGRRAPTVLVHEKEEGGEHQQEELEANPRNRTFKVEVH